MFYCDKCKTILVLIKELKDNEGNIVLVYRCPKCHRIKYVKK